MLLKLKNEATDNKQENQRKKIEIQEVFRFLKKAEKLNLL